MLSLYLFTLQCNKNVVMIRRDVILVCDVACQNQALVADLRLAPGPQNVESGFLAESISKIINISIIDTMK